MTSSNAGLVVLEVNGHEWDEIQLDALGDNFSDLTSDKVRPKYHRTVQICSTASHSISVSKTVDKC